MSDVKISVIVPVYQVKEEYLQDCVHSILHQTLRSIELLLIDDGAPERLSRILDHYAQVDERVRVIRQQQAGVSAARNAGLNAARGTYITFVDSDDTIREDNLESVYAFATEHELEITMWGVYKCFPEGREEYMPFVKTIPLLNEEQKRDLMLKTMVGDLSIYGKLCSRWGSGSCGAKLYLRSFLQREKLVYPVGIVRAEDVNFNIRAFDVADRIGYLHRFFYDYRQLSESATYRYRDGGIKVFEDALRGLKSFLDQTKKDEVFYQVYYIRCMFFFLESMDMDYLHPENEKPLLARLRELKKKAGEEMFATAAKQLDVSYLTMIKRIPVFLIRHRLIVLLVIFYGLYRKVRKG